MLEKIEQKENDLLPEHDKLTTSLQHCRVWREKQKKLHDRNEEGKEETQDEEDFERRDRQSTTKKVYMGSVARWQEQNNQK